MTPRPTWLRTGVVALVCSWVVAGTALGGLYTFEDLGNGVLNGQDNWGSYPAYPGNQFSVQNGTGINTSKVAMSVSGRPAFALRPNDGNFSFTPHSSSDTSAVIQFDIQASTADTVSTYFGLAYDADGTSGVNTVNERGPAFGILRNAGGQYGFAIQHLGNSVSGAVVEDFGTWTVAERAALDGDWVTLRMTVDFTANSGGGSAQLSYMNLTDGETVFSDIGSAVNLGLTTRYAGAYAGVADPANWDTMVLVRANEVGMPTDNLLPNAAVPEPSSLALSATLLGFGLLGLLCRKCRQRV